MNEENHIIKFKYSFGLYNRLCINNDFRINVYQLFKKNPYDFYIDIYYNNLNIHSLIISDYYNYIFNISNMLYKIHNPNYYRRYNHKELI